jgi:excisionase family DNA binding protein
MPLYVLRRVDDRLFYNLRELAGLLDLPERAVRRMLQGGQIRVLRWGRRFLIHHEEVTKYLSKDLGSHERALDAADPEARFVAFR